MAVCRIEKTRDYTVMANHYLRNKALSLKAKGLLSLMLSLPEDWDYTVKGLAYICKDGIDSINGAIKELETAGYMSRQRIRNEKGQLTATEYTIREYPTAMDGGISPAEGEPAQEEHDQLNTYLQTMEQSKKDLFNTETSNPYQSYPYPRKKTGYDEIGCET